MRLLAVVYCIFFKKKKGVQRTLYSAIALLRILVGSLILPRVRQLSHSYYVTPPVQQRARHVLRMGCRVAGLLVMVRVFFALRIDL
jgi:hypothetical protein